MIRIAARLLSLGVLAVASAAGLLAGGCGSGGSVPSAGALGTGADAGGSAFSFNPMPSDVADTTPQQRAAAAHAGLVGARGARLQHQLFAIGRRIAQTYILTSQTGASRADAPRRAAAQATTGQDLDSGLYYSASTAAGGAGSATLYYDQAMANPAGSISWTAPAASASGQGTTITFTESHFLSASGSMALEADDAGATTGKATIDLSDDPNTGQATEAIHADLDFKPDPSNPQAGGLDVTGSFTITDPQRTISVGLGGAPLDLQGTSFFTTDTAGDSAHAVVGEGGAVYETCFHPVSNYGGSGSASNAQAAFIVVSANGQTQVTFADESTASPGNIDTSNPETWTITDTPSRATTTTRANASEARE